MTADATRVPPVPVVRVLDAVRRRLRQHQQKMVPAPTNVLEMMTVCRVCNKGCALIAEVVDGRLVTIRGDHDNPLYVGYTCLKGRAMPEFLNSPDRLLHSLKRTPDGGFEQIPFERALDEIAVRLQAIREEYGPRAVATYYGTQMQNVPVGPLMHAFAEAIGTRMNFGALSVDKPGRRTSASRTRGRS